jgi:hypothetical protein
VLDCDAPENKKNLVNTPGRSRNQKSHPRHTKNGEKINGLFAAAAEKKNRKIREKKNWDGHSTHIQKSIKNDSFPFIVSTFFLEVYPCQFRGHFSVVFRSILVDFGRFLAVFRAKFSPCGP